MLENPKSHQWDLDVDRLLQVRDRQSRASHKVRPCYAVRNSKLSTHLRAVSPSCWNC